MGLELESINFSGRKGRVGELFCSTAHWRDRRVFIVGYRHAANGGSSFVGDGGTVFCDGAPSGAAVRDVPEVVNVRARRELTGSL